MATKIVQIFEKNSSGGYDTIYPISAEKTTITVNSVTGATVVCTETGESYTYTSNSSYAFTVYQTNTVYNFTATKGSSTETGTVTVTSSGVYTLNFYFVSKTLNDNSWSGIRSITDKGTQSSYWSVGAVKMETIKGTIGSKSINGSYGFFILDLAHRTE